MNDGQLKRILPAQVRGPGISVAKEERADYGKLTPDKLRPLIARDVEAFLAAGGQITQVPPGAHGSIDDE